MSKRAVIYIRLDSFFTSVEAKRRPGLKGRPVVVGAGGDPKKRGDVAAASRDAEEAGVLPGMELKKAREICPEAVFLPVDFEAYEKASERFFSTLSELSPLVESLGLDEAFVEMLPREGKDSFPDAIKTAGEVKEIIEAGLGLPATIGVGPNKFMAVVAVGLDRPVGPGGVHIIWAEEAGRVLKDMPSASLPGVGRGTAERLNSLGIRTVGDLSKAPLQHLERNFGADIGKALYERSRGVDGSPVVPFHEPDAVSREVAFDVGTEDQYVIKEALYALAGEVVARLKGLGRKGKDVAIKIGYSDLETVARSATLDAESDSLNDVWKAASKLLERSGPRKAVRLVGVKVAGLKGRG